MHPLDQESFSKLLDEHGAALVLYAQHWCRNPEDVVQDAFIRLMRQQPFPANIVGWLYCVIRNDAISASRSHCRRTRHETAAAAGKEQWFKTSNDVQLDAASATEALKLIPTEQREVVVLRIWSGLSFEEIAELIGKSVSTAHRRYEAGLESLRKHWDSKCRT